MNTKVLPRNTRDLFTKINQAGLFILCAVLLNACKTEPPENHVYTCLEPVDSKLRVLEIFQARHEIRYMKVIKDLQDQLDDYVTQTQTIPKPADPRVLQDIADVLKIRQEEITAFKEELRIHTATYEREKLVLREQRSKILADYGIRDGFCEIHGVKMTEQSVPVSYGFPAQKLDGYWESLKNAFPNADTPITGGCGSGEAEWPRTLTLPVCPKCVKARKAWLKKQAGSATSAKNRMSKHE